MMFRDLYEKELRAYFFTPAAYVVAAAFLLIAGWMFAAPLFLTDESTLNAFFLPAPILLAFFAPAVAMRLFAEEAKTGTLEILLALPATEWELVAAKYAAALTVVLGALALTFPYALVVGVLGRLDWGATALGYVGVALCAALMTAAGTLASTLTRNQVVAFILGFALCFALALAGNFAEILPRGPGAFADFVGIDSHLRALARGTLDLRDLVYFVSAAALLLYGARLRVSEWRR
jgi:ABC-2 type transport system permease protein